MKRKLILIYAALLVSFLIPDDLSRRSDHEGMPYKTLSLIPKIEALKVSEKQEYKNIPVSVQEIARSEATNFGWSQGNEWAAIEKLWGNESNWEVGRLNKDSLACGIVQAWPCEKLYGLSDDKIMKEAVYRNGKMYLASPDARKELKWGMGYIQERYGSPSSALAFWYAQCGSSKGCWY